MKKILLSMFALGAMFAFVSPAVAQDENEDGTYTYSVRRGDFTPSGFYQDNEEANYFRTYTSKDFAVQITASSTWWNRYNLDYAPLVYAGGTLTYTCLDEDYVIKNVYFYAYTWDDTPTFTCTNTGQVFKGEMEEGASNLYIDVEVVDVNAEVVTITNNGTYSNNNQSFYYIDCNADGTEVYGGITIIEKDAIEAGVKDIKVKNQQDGRIFDVQGREVLNPTKGMYIQNGKKFMVK